MPSDTTSTQQPSIASLTEEIDFLAEAKQQWDLGVSGASEALQQPIQVLRDYASQMRRTVAMLQTSIARVNTTVALMETAHTHHMQVLFDDPMDELRSNITALRDDYQQTLSEGIVPPAPGKHRVIPERVAPLCVLFETYAGVNGERMRVPPDVVEGIVPMMVRHKSRVFYREIAMGDFETINNQITERRFEEYDLPHSIGTGDVSAILRAHHWCVLYESWTGAEIYGTAHFYDDAGAEQYLVFRWSEGSKQYESDGRLTVAAEASQWPLVEVVVRDVIKDIEGAERTKKRTRSDESV